MTDILDEIIAHKRLEIEQQKAAISQELLINNCNEPMPRRSMRASLSASPSGIIAEFKRRSPSKGWIKENAQADIIPPAYEMAGASVLSILTDENFFGGNLKDIRAARPQVSLPILRKDFIIDEYQLYQACIVGADAVLLIAAALRKEQCSMLAAKAHELKLEVLLEIHSEQNYSHQFLDTGRVITHHCHSPEYLYHFACFTTDRYMLCDASDFCSHCRTILYS